METTNWQKEDVTDHYLQQVRGGIPYGVDQTKIMLQVISHFNSSPNKFIDLGCGNGILSETLLRAYPKASALLIDHSKPMIDKAHLQMKNYMDRCQIIHGDFSQSLYNYAEPGTIDCIISAYAIHHLPNEKKKKLYEEIFNLLAPGGIFINVEHTASASSELEKIYDELFIDHLASYNNRSREEIAIEYYNRPDKEDNILERVDVQVNWLREIGFRHADCFFKWFELAVFGGVK